MDLTDDKLDDFLFKGLVVILIVILGALLVYSYINVKPETFTQVYLIPDKIENTAMVGEKISIEFEIDNREGKTVEYEYKMFFEGQQVNFFERTVLVENEEKKRIIEEISFTEPTEGKQKFVIEVSKPEMDEPYSIWFWIDVYPSVLLDAELQECYDNIPETASIMFRDCFRECCRNETEKLQECYESCFEGK